MKTKHSGRFVAYYRVSTARQGKSGLGLEAQRQAVEEHLNGGKWQLVAEFTEIESGKRSDRTKLAEALKACRLRGAKLVIAKGLNGRGISAPRGGEWSAAQVRAVMARAV
jgi:DNA invertase Pin-like site-specific DNA recombinase